MNNHLIRSSNNLSMGIVGLPNIGKSTLFNLLTNSDSPVEDYPFCTIEPHISLIIPNDKKLEFLTSLYNPLKSTPFSIKIHDIAGLVKGASEGAGLGNEFLENIRQVDGIIHVIKVFKAEEVKESVEIIKEELRLKDLQIVQSNKKSIPPPLFNKLITILQNKKSIKEEGFDKNECKLIIQLNLLTVKNVIYLCNVSPQTYAYIENKKKEINTSKEESLLSKLTIKENLSKNVKNVTETITNVQKQKTFIDSEIKKELQLLKDLKDCNTFLYCKDKINKDLLVERIKECLNIITFYTAGKKEVKGWTISKGTTANYAGKVIHTDFVDNFIALDCIKYSDMVEHKLDCKKLGKLMTKGKTYEVEEGDILEFKIGTKGKKR